MGSSESRARLPEGFRLCAFAELDLVTLYAILALRQRVFVVEQRCSFLDADGRDAHALHLVHQGPAIDAYARLFLPDRVTPHAHLGRVLTAPEVRGQGLGQRLVLVALALLEELAPKADVHIAAQAHLEAWYAKHRFVAVGRPYFLDGIAHRDMVRFSASAGR